MPSSQINLFDAAIYLALFVAVVMGFIPPGREPAFLRGSQWRPVLSRLGRQGLQSLPPEVEEYIDRMKRQRGL